MTITNALSTWLAETPSLAQGQSLSLARNAMIDIAGCLVAGSADQAPRRVLAAVRDLGEGPASIVGDMARLTAPYAAVVNGTAAHAIDFDDNYHGVAGHATAVLAPALLALGEERGAGGRTVLDAYIAGLEAQFIVGAGVNPAHYERGWHTTSTVAMIGAAGAAARMIGLDAAGVARALGLSLSHAGGSKLQLGTMAKPFHAGMAAMNALMVARYAEAGVTATPEPLSAPWGFLDLYIGLDSAPGYDRVAERLGPPTAIERFGLKVKVHANCASVHCAADGLLALMAEHGLAANDIDRVDTVVNKMTYDNLMYDEPGNEMEARFSMQYGLALILARGRMARQDFQPEVIDDPAIRAWLPRITMTESPEDGRLDTAPNGREPALVTVHTRDGRSFETFVMFAKGGAAEPDDCRRDVGEVRRLRRRCRRCWPRRGTSFRAGGLRSARPGRRPDGNHEMAAMRIGATRLAAFHLADGRSDRCSSAAIWPHAAASTASDGWLAPQKITESPSHASICSLLEMDAWDGVGSCRRRGGTTIPERPGVQS